MVEKQLVTSWGSYGDQRAREPIFDGSQRLCVTHIVTSILGWDMPLRSCRQWRMKVWCVLSFCKCKPKLSLWSRPLLNYLIKIRNDERKWVHRWWWLRVHKPRLESLRDVPFSSRRQVACREVAVGDLDYWSWLASPATCCTWVCDPPSNPDQQRRYLPSDDFVQSWLFSGKFQFLQ